MSLRASPDGWSPSSPAKSGVAAIVLAAGRGARFGGPRGKLLAELSGRPLARLTVEAALASRASRTIVVTGHARAEIEAALADLPVVFAHNADYASGMASSLRVGLSQAEGSAGALILLADMPGVTPAILDLLIAAFERAPPSCMAVAPVFRGLRGNPVLLARALLPRLAELDGDAGAGRLLRSLSGVLETPVDDEAVLADMDTREDLELWRMRLGAGD